MDNMSVHRIDPHHAECAKVEESERHSVSPVESLWTVDSLPSLPSPIAATTNEKSWVRLKSINPEILHELRKTYGLPGYTQNHNNVKGASKVKAWIRQKPLRLILRFRQKISENSDEVIDAEVIAEPTQDQSDPHSNASELPDNISSNVPNNVLYCEAPWNPIYEAPSVVPVSEMDVDSISRTWSFRSNNIWTTDPVPTYESVDRAVNCTQQIDPDSKGTESSGILPTAQTVQGMSNLDPTPPIELPGDSLVTPPAKGHRPGQAVELLLPNDKREPDTTTDTHDQSTVHLDKSKRPFPPAKVDTEAMISLWHTLMQSAEDRTSTRRSSFKVINQRRYETETDVEPPSPSDLPRARPLRLRTSYQTLKQQQQQQQQKKTPLSRKHKGFHPKTPLSSDEASGNSDVDPDTDLRHRSLQGAPSLYLRREAVLTSILRVQAEMLAPGHPLTVKAKQRRPRKQKEWQRRRVRALLATLCKSESTAKATLGENNPLLQAFSADLETLKNLVDSERPAASGENGDQASESPDSAASSPVASAVDEQVEQTCSSADLSLKTGPTATDHQARSSQGEAHLAPCDIQDARVLPQSLPNNGAKAGTLAGSDFLRIVQRSQHAPPRIAIFSGLVVSTLVTRATKALQWIQRNYGSEPPLERGKARVRWTCSCGEQLYDDFIELRPGAARDLETFLNRPRTQTSGGDSFALPPSPNDSSGTNSLDASPVSILSSQTSWSSYGVQQLQKPEDSYQRERVSETISAASMYPTAYRLHPEPPYLLTCTSEDRFTTKMTHVDVGREHITSDMRLALALRQHYANVNRHWWRGLRLRGLSAIEFVQFEVHSNRFADIRKSPDMPPEAGADYEFVADTLPPIGSKLLLHLFRHPQDYDRELMAYQRMPKRTVGRLHIGVGWGLHLVEDFLADRLALLINTFVLFASFVFAIAWVCARNDVQGAFAVAQWICMVTVVACGWVQVYIG